MSNGITFVVQPGGLGRRLPGSDYISGLIFQFPVGEAPTGIIDGVKGVKVSSLEEAEALGIVSTSANDSVKILHYHVSEYFRIYEGKTLSIGDLWLKGVESAVVEQDFLDLQTAANGTIKQIAVYNDVPFAASLVTTANTAADTLLQNKQPAVIVVTGDFTGFTDLSTLPDIRALDQDYVSVDFSQDGSGTGKALFDSVGKTVSGIGTVLGTIAAAAVNLNIGWRAQFNIAGVEEYQEPATGEGTTYDDLTASEEASLQTKGYIFAQKETGLPGAYYYDSPQAVLVDSDFAYIENSRTIFKAIREINTRILPFQNAPIIVDAVTGKITEETIFELESTVFRGLNELARNGEIAVDQTTQRLPQTSVFIDPDQNVLSTSTVNITVRIVPTGVQRETKFNIGFTPKIQGN